MIIATRNAQTSMTDFSTTWRPGSECPSRGRVKLLCGSEVSVQSESPMLETSPSGMNTANNSTAIAASDSVGGPKASTRLADEFKNNIGAITASASPSPMAPKNMLFLITFSLLSSDIT